MVEVGLIVVVCLAILASIMIIRRGPDRSGRPVEDTDLPDIEIDLKLQDDLRELAAQGHTEQAIKLARKRTKLNVHQATLVVQALMVGRVFSAPDSARAGVGQETNRSDAVIDDALLNRLHALIAQDPVSRTAALQLLRAHTGMNAKDARRFVDAL